MTEALLRPLADIRGTGILPPHPPAAADDKTPPHTSMRRPGGIRSERRNVGTWRARLPEAQERLQALPQDAPWAGIGEGQEYI
jgi:hypothetical protein